MFDVLDSCIVLLVYFFGCIPYANAPSLAPSMYTFCFSFSIVKHGFFYLLFIRILCCLDIVTTPWGIVREISFMGLKPMRLFYFLIK